MQKKQSGILINEAGHYISRYLDKYERKIKRLQQELSRKIKGSKNYIKCKKKIEEVYRKT